MEFNAGRHAMAHDSFCSGIILVIIDMVWWLWIVCKAQLQFPTFPTLNTHIMQIEVNEFQILFWQFGL